MATTATAPRGSGLYLRNTIWWVRIRTPAVLEPKENSLRRFFRFSTRTSCFSEASRAAAHVRAALDRGFALARFELGTSMVDAVQVEAMLTRLAQNALAAAEASRALAGVRDAARIAEARRRHEEDLIRWRDALARSELTQIGAQVGRAAQEAGVPASAMASPIAMRETARTLAAAAEENISREHGIYAGDRPLLSARLDASADLTSPQAMAAGQLHLAPAIPLSSAPVIGSRQRAEACDARLAETNLVDRCDETNEMKAASPACTGSPSDIAGAGVDRPAARPDRAAEPPEASKDSQTDKARQSETQASPLAGAKVAEASRARKRSSSSKAGRARSSRRPSAKPTWPPPESGARQTGLLPVLFTAC